MSNIGTRALCASSHAVTIVCLLSHLKVTYMFCPVEDQRYLKTPGARGLGGLQLSGKGDGILSLNYFLQPTCTYWKKVKVLKQICSVIVSV
jgi:hypothetical protein